MRRIMRSKKKLTTAVLTATMTTIFAAGMACAADFDQTITGAADNAPYAADGILENGTYTFKEDASIKNATAVDVKTDLALSAEGHVLNLDGKVNLDPGKNLTVTAKTLNINASSEAARLDIIHIGGNAGSRSTMTVKGDTNITITTPKIGMTYVSNGDLTIDGNLTIDNKSASTSTSKWSNNQALYLAGAMGGGDGANVKVTGNTDIKSTGIGVHLNISNSHLDLTNGDVSIAAKANPNAEFAAIIVEGGIADINVEKDDTGALIGAKDHTVKIDGDVHLDAGQVNPKDTHGVMSQVNLALVNADSYLHGVVWNAYPDAGIKSKDLTFKGEAHMYLQNGAIWENAAQQKRDKKAWGTGPVAFDGVGSQLTTLVGGDSVKTAGYIIQKDEDPITVKKLKGEVVALYERNAEKPMEVKGGEFIVDGVEDSAAVHVRTDSAGLNLSDPESAATKETVKTVLGHLAEKLIFVPATEGGTGLAGYAEIAEGLTSSAALKFNSKLNFDATEGRGEITDIEVIVPDETEVPVAFGSEETTTMRGVREAMMLPILNFRSSMNDLSKRLGDVRYGDIDKGVWALVEHGKSEYKAEGINDSMNYTSLQTGYDRELDNGWVVGGMFQYVNGDPKGDFINGTVKNFALGAYGTKVNADGSYMDVVGKFGRISNDYTVVNKDNIKVDADYHANAGMISMEYGKRFADDRGFYVEPQGELSYGRVAGQNYDANTTFAGNTKLHVDQDAYDSLVGRLGVAVGYATDKGSAFAKLSVSHEFAGDMDITYAATNQPTKTTHVDGKDTWTTFQLGGTYQTAENMYVYGNALTTFGGDYKEKYKLNLGVRFQF